jgi:uncharacterized protein
MRFLDANVFLRHLTGDDPVKHPACVALFRQIGAGRVQAWTTDLAIAEVVFVLSSKKGMGYAFAREQIQDGLLPLLRLPGLHLSTKSLYPRIFDLYVTLNIDFIDAYHAALVEQVEPPELYSYDTDFDRVKAIARLEP